MTYNLPFDPNNQQYQQKHIQNITMFQALLWVLGDRCICESKKQASKQTKTQKVKNLCSLVEGNVKKKQ